jgi:hypothetical protein
MLNYVNLLYLLIVDRQMLSLYSFRAAWQKVVLAGSARSSWQRQIGAGWQCQIVLAVP